MIETHLVDGKGAHYAVKVTALGQLVTSQFAFETTSFQALDAINTAFNMWLPVSGELFIVTGIRIKASRSVSQNDDATVVVYESSAIDSVVEDTVIYEDRFIRGEAVTLTGLNIQTSTTKFINAKTTDATMLVNLVGFYVPVTA